MTFFKRALDIGGGVKKRESKATRTGRSGAVWLAGAVGNLAKKGQSEVIAIAEMQNIVTKRSIWGSNNC